MVSLAPNQSVSAPCKEGLLMDCPKKHWNPHELKLYTGAWDKHWELKCVTSNLLLSFWNCTSQTETLYWFPQQPRILKCKWWLWAVWGFNALRPYNFFSWKALLGVKKVAFEKSFYTCNVQSKPQQSLSRGLMLVMDELGQAPSSRALCQSSSAGVLYPSAGIVEMGWRYSDKFLLFLQGTIWGWLGFFHCERLPCVVTHRATASKNIISLSFPALPFWHKEKSLFVKYC